MFQATVYHHLKKAACEWSKRNYVWWLLKPKLLTGSNEKLLTLHEKPYFLFQNVLKRWFFQNNCTAIWSFLYHQERWYFFSPKIWPNSLEGKWRMIFLKKYMEIWYFFQVLWKDGLSKKIALEYDLSCVIRKDGVCFFRKYDVFSMDEKWKMIFLKKYMEIWCFLNIW